MAKIFDKESSALGMDRTLVLDQREALVYPFPFDDWNVIRVGFFYSFTNTVGDNEQIVPNGGTADPVLNVVGRSDRFYFGIKSSNDKFPGDGEPYAGFVHFNNQANFHFRQYNGGSLEREAAFLNYSTNTSHAYGAIQANGVLSPSPRWGIGRITIPMAHHMAQSSVYAGFMSMIFVIENKGTSSQSINVRSFNYVSNAESGGTSNTSDTNLKNLMYTNSHLDWESVPFNLSGVPYKLPNSVFLYQPFPIYRMRIHNLGVFKVS